MTQFNLLAPWMQPAALAISIISILVLWRSGRPIALRSIIVAIIVAIAVSGVLFMLTAKFSPATPLSLLATAWVALTTLVIALATLRLLRRFQPTHNRLAAANAHTHSAAAKGTQPSPDADAATGNSATDANTAEVADLDQRGILTAIAAAGLGDTPTAVTRRARRGRPGSARNRAALRAEQRAAKRQAKRGKRLLGSMLMTLFTLLGVLGGLLGVNVVTGGFAKLGDLWGADKPAIVPFTQAHLNGKAPTNVPKGPLDSWYRLPPSVPKTGQVSTVTIPASSSGVQAREAYLYLPPAALDPNGPPLPVLMLLHGVPGGPVDFTAAAKKSMDAFAAGHHGLAPIVVFPDATGSTAANPLCADAAFGKWATYLQTDVPNWVNSHLRTDSPKWAVGGLSYGATCSLQIGAREPTKFPVVLNLSGELAPTLDDKSATLSTGFGGDKAAFAANNPIDLFASRSYAGLTVAFAIGASDPGVADLKKVYQAAAAAGATATFDDVLPGDHNWNFWGAALDKYTPWLGKQLGITS